MRDRPNADELLAEARRTLLEEVLPELAGERRYQALMIANAIAIAQREFAAALADDAPTLAALLGLGQESGIAAAALERRLAKAIRAGRFDAPAEGRPALRVWLQSEVEGRLRLSNPKALREADMATPERK